GAAAGAGLLCENPRRGGVQARRGAARGGAMARHELGAEADTVTNGCATALVEPWFDGRGPKGTILNILERYRHDLGRAVDGDMTEELHAFAGRQVLPLLFAGRLDVADLRTECVVEFVGTEGSGVQRSRHEFPEWVEVLKHRPVRIIVMRGGVMHVGGQPDRVANTRMLDEGEKIRDLELAAKRRAVALRDRFDAPLAVDVIDDDQAQGHVGSDHFPGRARRDQLALEPGDLHRAEEIGIGAVAWLAAFAIR